jgi:hypothetical protein
LSFVFSPCVFAEPVLVSSLEELMPYLKKDNVQVVMTPGTYRISGDDAKAGTFGTPNFQDWVRTLLPFEGSNSTYDFTDVTLEVETSVFQSYGHLDVYELQTFGNHIVIKNLTIVDVGSVYDAPTRGALGIVMDGSHNRIEGVHLSTKGSYPYGYGESFGKGGKNVVGHQKHCGILVRGLSNHVKDCTIIHRCFGHALFMQAADQPMIEGCTIEGEMVFTDNILAEKGTGTIADKVDFMTYFGYPIPPGYAMCTGEEGIRAYNGGSTLIDGKVYKRAASNPTILNCMIKNMRGGVTLTHATGKKYVEGTTAIGCSRGFAIGTGELVDCYADTQYGPALGVDYENNSGMNAEVTLLPYDGPSYNGGNQAAYITGNNHQITLKNKVANPDQKLILSIGGNKRGIGNLGKDENYSARNITFNNETAYPVVLGARTENITGRSGGMVTDLGTGNQLEHVPVALGEVNADQIAIRSSGDHEFEIDVPLSGMYLLDYQIVSVTSGVFSVAVEGDLLEQVPFMTSEETVRSSEPVFLSHGLQKIRVSSATSDWTLNSIRLLLECAAVPIVPYIEEINAQGKSIGKTQESALSVFPGHTVYLDPEPAIGGSWQWTGPNGFSSDERKAIVSDVQKNQSGSYVATFINDGGYSTTQIFEITVQDLISIEAENYSSMNGISTEITTDTGGGSNVTHGTTNGWMEYEIDIPYSALYVLGFRVAGESAGGFTAGVEGAEMESITFDATGGDQIWKTVGSRSPLYLKPGLHTLRLTSTNAGWNINWIKLKALEPVMPCSLPVIFEGDRVLANFSSGVLDISNESPIDVHVVFKGRSSAEVYGQIDGGKEVALAKRSGPNGWMMASATGLSGNTLKLVVQSRSKPSNIEGIYFLKSTDPFARIEA